MTSRLKNSINELYETFKKYHSNSNMIGSSNYNDLGKWNKELFAKPLTELNEDDLSIFTAKVMTTWGCENDFKHFLPRIFELTAELKTPYEIWIAFDKLTIESSLKTGNFHKMNYFGWDFYFLKFSDALVSVN